MGVFIRGVKNAFRNLVRTLSVTLILALSIGLALIMLLSYQTVQNKISSVTATIGNTITVNPAGGRGFEGGGEPLTEAQVSQISGLAKVAKVEASLQDRLTPGDNNNLASAIDPGTLGNRFSIRTQGGESGAQVAPGGVGVAGGSSGAAGTSTRAISLPISVTGMSDPSSLTTGSSSLTSGALFAVNSEENVALVGAQLATKNNLAAGSTFTAYGNTLTVKGIYDAGNQFANSGLYMPLKTLQRLSEQTGSITAATVTVDSITDVDAVVAAIKDKLGADKVDITSTKEAATEALEPLENIKRISLYSLFGSLVAGAVITLLIMMMIVRERRREIGVLKAIGASNIGVVMQFVWESLVLTVLGAVLGIIAGAAFSNPVLNALVANNSASGNPEPGGFPGGVAGRGVMRIARFGGQLGGDIQNTVRNIHATVGTEIILYGLAAAVLIAIIGSAIPAWLIAKVKPAEVMRGE